MTETLVEVETVVANCPTCGRLEFNPDCPDCHEAQERSWLAFSTIEGFDV
jgi:uncharacterized OB-fold protein